MNEKFIQVGIRFSYRLQDLPVRTFPVLVALLAHLVVEALEIAVVAVKQVAVEISPLLAKRYEVSGIELEIRMKMEGCYVVDLKLFLRPAPLAFGLLLQVFFFHPVPLRAPKMGRLALD